jgi:hypothetical protein
MDKLLSLTKDTLHHAYLLIRDTDGVYEEICPFFEKNLGIKTKGNADFVFEKFDKFLIDDARRIFDLHMGKTHRDSLQIIVIAFNFITTQAQNALLKMLEEPTDRTHFFIISPNKNIFLDTIISRVSVFEMEDSGFPASPAGRSILDSGKKFLEMSLKDRLDYVSKFVKDLKDEKRTKQDAINLLSGIESSMRREIKNSKDYEKGSDALKQVVKSKGYINLNGASVKNLLENIALNV